MAGTALAVVTATVKSIDQKTISVYGKIVVDNGTSHTDYAAKGLTMDMTKVANSFGCAVTSFPLEVNIKSTGVDQTALYVYLYNPGSTTSTSAGKLQIFTGAAAQSGLTELSNGAVPSGVTSDNIRFHAIWLREATSKTN